MFKRLIAGFGRKELVPDIATLQGEVVRSIVSDIRDLHDGEWEEREWVHIAINHEMSIEDGMRSSSQTIVLARKAMASLKP